MHLLGKFNKLIPFLMCVFDIFSKYAWVVSFNDKRSITITDAFQKILDDSGRKPNKIWIGKGREFHNESLKSWLQDNNIELYSTNY